MVHGERSFSLFLRFISSFPLYFKSKMSRLHLLQKVANVVVYLFFLGATVYSVVGPKPDPKVILEHETYITPGMFLAYLIIFNKCPFFLMQHSCSFLGVLRVVCHPLAFGRFRYLPMVWACSWSCRPWRWLALCYFQCFERCLALFVGKFS